MSWATALELIHDLGLDQSLFPVEGAECDVWSVIVPIGWTFNQWLWVMNNELQPEGWIVQSLSILLDGLGRVVVAAIARRLTVEQLRPPAGGGLLVPQPQAPPNLRPV